MVKKKQDGSLEGSGSDPEKKLRELIEKNKAGSSALKKILRSLENKDNENQSKSSKK